MNKLRCSHLCAVIHSLYFSLFMFCFAFVSSQRFFRRSSVWDWSVYDGFCLREISAFMLLAEQINGQRTWGSSINKRWAHLFHFIRSAFVKLFYTFGGRAAGGIRNHTFIKCATRKEKRNRQQILATTKLLNSDIRVPLKQMSFKHISARISHCRMVCSPSQAFSFM